MVEPLCDGELPDLDAHVPCDAIDRQTNRDCRDPAGWLVRMFCTVCKDHLVRACPKHLVAARDADRTNRGITHSRDGGYLVLWSWSEFERPPTGGPARRTA
jgi:hypothetical protein